VNALQEEITQKTLALCVEASKMTAQLLQQANCGLFSPLTTKATEK